MTIVESLVLFATMAALAAVPSASVALVVARSALLGTPHGAAVAAGIVLGDLTFVALVMLGLTVIAETLGSLLVVIRYLGAAYLLWLGVSLWRARPKEPFAVAVEGQRGSFLTSFLAGFLLTLGDIKAIFFYLSLLPLFIDLAMLQVGDIAIVCVITVVAVGGVKVVYAYYAGRVVAASSSLRYRRLVTRAAGTALVGTGGYLLVKT